jgi:hypothetical protein
MIACSAVKKKIPVYFFKHDGIENIFLKEAPYDSYFKQEKIVKRTQFVHSKADINKYSSSLIKTEIIGPLKRVEKFYIKKNLKKTLPILYTISPPMHWSYKDINRIISDSEKNQLIFNIIKNIKKYKLQLDIKIHPADISSVIPYFKNLRQKHKKYVKLIVGGNVERIINDYGMIVTDLISSKVMSTAMETCIPIATYLKSDNILNPKTFKDFKSRVMTFNDNESLSIILKKYSRGGILPKSNKGFNSKYFTYQQNESIQKAKKVIFD